MVLPTVFVNYIQKGEEIPQHARQRRFPRNGGQGEIRRPRQGPQKSHRNAMAFLWSQQGLNLWPSDYESDATNQLSYGTEFAKPGQTGSANIDIYPE